jgi:hypothetical protein
MKVLLIGAAVLVLLAGCASDPTITPVPEGALMAVQTRGGFCPAGACETTILVERDGLVHQAAKPPNNLGLVPAEALAELEQQILAADYEEIRSHPFTGFCPTAFDGQELIFEFAGPEGPERIESCRVEVDYSSPLFSAVAAAVGTYVALPVGE